MAFQIRVVPDVLRQSAEYIEQIINDNDQLYARIKVIAHKLDESWDGAASEFMIDELHKLLEYLNKAKEHFAECRQALEVIVQAFENIDDSEGTNLVSIFRADIRAQIQEYIKIVGPGGSLFSKQLPLSSGHIRVIPDGLREAAHEAQTAIEISNEILNKTNKVLSELQNSWEGRAYNKFSDGFIQIKEIYVKLLETFEEFSQKVITVANRYEEIDNLFN